MSIPGDTMSIPGGYREYSGGYREYTGGCSVHQGISWVHQGISWVHRGLTMISVGDIMSTLGVFSTQGDIMNTPGGVQYTGGFIMSTLGDTKMHVGVITSTPRMFSTLGGYHEYTRGFSVQQRDNMSTPGGYHEYTLGDFGKNEKKPLPNFDDFCSCTFCDYAGVYGTSDSLLKYLYQVASAQTLTHFLFHLWSEIFSFKMSSRYVARWMKICAAFTLRSKKVFTEWFKVICFKHFWTNVSKLAGESMIKNLSQLRPVKFLGLVSVMVLMMTMFVDEMILRCRSCLCQESLTSNLKLTKTLWLVTWKFCSGFFSFVPKSPGVLMISPSVLMVSPKCTHDNPPHASWYPPVYSW